MKKVFIIFTLLLLAISLFAEQKISTGFDIGFLQDFALSKNAIQFSMDSRLSLADNYEIRVPLTVSVKKTEFFFDTGLFAICYPYKSLFFGISVFETGFASKNSNLDKNSMVLNEILIGWTQHFKDRFFIEPCLVIKDPTGTYADEYSLIKGVFPCYRDFRLRINFGIDFTLRNKHEKNI